MRLKLFFVAIIIFFFASGIFSQTETFNDGKYTYTTVKNDPLKTRIYVLENGLTVYMAVNKDVPRIQTRITVRAGSKYDPADATGLAHYLEHLLFKGTSKFGTKDFDSEKPLIEEIIFLFETYRSTTDSILRKNIYHKIDSVSLLASNFAIPNEYDKMLQGIGAIGTNAFTTDEHTTYVNDIPSNQLEKWVIIESERFRQPIMRLFHTELEVVYEEKNRSLDNGDSKAWEALYSGLFKKHQYGTQTTIGTIEHLKNPSIQKVIDYFNTYYVPNNMAICLVGDFEPSSTIELIDNYFGKFQRKELPVYIPPIEESITQPIYEEVFSPEAENLLLGYRLDNVTEKDADVMEIMNNIFYNGTAGLIDLNLVQTQKVLSAGSYFWNNKDYSTLIFYGNPRSGQTLEELKDLLLSQVDVLKKGDFPDWYLSAVVNNLKVNRLNEIQNPGSSIWGFVNTFALDIPWEEYVNRIQRLSQITKEDIIDYADKNFNNNFVCIYKRTGEDKNVMKVIKPEITPVTVNRNSESDFYKYINEIKSPAINPEFLDYKKDFKTLNLKNGISIYYIQNKDNDLFNLYYVLDMGTNNDKKIGLAINYLQYLGTSKFSPTELKREFFKLGCSFNVFNSDKQTYVSLSGIRENMEKGIELLEELLLDTQPNEPALKNLVSDILKNRTDDKLSKDRILFSAMLSYGFWGKYSPFTNILSEKELNELNSEELITRIKKLNTYKHEIIYYGPETTDKMSQIITQYHNTPDVLNLLPPEYNFSEQSTNENNIYVVNYDMKQAEIIMLSKGVKFDKDIVPIVKLFNSYAGDVVFQDLREAKALAYSVFAAYRIPNEENLSFYTYSYIGTQADKLKEALEGMTGILNNMPLTDGAFNSAKDGVLEKIRTKRIIKADIIFSYLSGKKLGLDYDIRKDIYDKVNNYKIEDLKQFMDTNIKDKKYTILILGDKNKLDKEVLEKFGKIKYLTLEEIFGY